MLPFLLSPLVRFGECQPINRQSEGDKTMPDKAAHQLQLETLGAITATNVLLSQIAATLLKGAPLTADEIVQAGKHGATLQAECINIALQAGAGVGQNPIA